MNERHLISKTRLGFKSRYWLHCHFYSPQTKFAPVCHSVRGGGGGWGSAPLHAGIPLTPDQRQVPPREQIHLWTRGRYPPKSRQPPRNRHLPPGAVHAGRYGQQTDGMHPTGMQSFCFFIFYFPVEKSKNVKGPIGRDIVLTLFINASTNIVSKLLRLAIKTLWKVI